jgi:ABC-2 type transport system ATP-binding protein
MDPMHAIETAALNKRFRRVHAVQDVTLQVAHGAVYTLMGPNGAGKTTLIKLLMNLTDPTSGRAVVLGGDSSQLRGRPLELVGYISENQKQPDWMTVGAFLRYWRPFYPTWDRALEDKLVEDFGLPRQQRLRHLSRGARMKAVLVSVLAYRPKLIVMDEPLSGLDPLVRDELMATLLEQRGQTTVLISSHDLAEIDSFATHVGYMDAGRLRISEPMTDLRERFRRVILKCSMPLRLPEKLPAEWLNFQAEGGVARWTESDFGESSSRTRARQLFGEVQLYSEPMTLREIFLLLARPPRPAPEEEVEPRSRRQAEESEAAE